MRFWRDDTKARRVERERRTIEPERAGELDGCCVRCGIARDGGARGASPCPRVVMTLVHRGKHVGVAFERGRGVAERDPSERTRCIARVTPDDLTSKMARRSISLLRSGARGAWP